MKGRRVEREEGGLPETATSGGGSLRGGRSEAAWAPVPNSQDNTETNNCETDENMKNKKKALVQKGGESKTALGERKQININEV